jgi:hypothetical protein
MKYAILMGLVLMAACGENVTAPQGTVTENYCARKNADGTLVVSRTPPPCPAGDTTVVIVITR